MSIEHSPIMMPSYEVRFTGYDDQNKPLTAEITAVSPNGDECIIPSVKISYPKLDEKGNWLEMELEYENPNGAWAPTVITRTIEYWPDDASNVDTFPTVPTEEFISELIIIADKPDKSLWSEQLRGLNKDFIESGITAINTDKLFDLGENPSDIADLEVKLIEPSADRSNLCVVFKYRLHNGSSYESDELEGIAKVVYENNTWKIDDIGYNAWSNAGSGGKYFPQGGWLTDQLTNELAKKFLYNAYYDNNIQEWENGYSQNMRDKFSKYGITTELNYPTNNQLSEDNYYYKPFYSDDFNIVLQELSKTENKVSDGIIGFDWDIFWGGQEGPYNFYLDIQSCFPGENNSLIVNTNHFKYTLVNNAGKWYIDNIDNLKEQAMQIVNEYK